MKALEFDHVTKSFASAAGGPAHCVLDETNLALSPGETVALVGRSGVGKTTLLYLAAGLMRPTGGTIRVGGEDLSAMNGAALGQLRRRGLGMVFQNNLSASALPVWENAALPRLLEGEPRKEARRAAGAMLERVGLGVYADQSTAALSGGQRRRLGLARSLLGEPALVLADEPTADLDEATGTMIEDYLFEWLRQGERAALIVTHSESMTRRADRVLRLEAGRLQSM